jgi:hypothetical protein
VVTATDPALRLETVDERGDVTRCTAQDVAQFALAERPTGLVQGEESLGTSRPATRPRSDP